MREIVSIQIGSYANFIGSHLWNFQDELVGLADCSHGDNIFKNHGLNMDVLYRTGETQQGVVTYTPRLVSVDFQGSLGALSSRGTLYDEVSPMPSEIVTWKGHVNTQAAEPVKKNLFLQSLHEEENRTATSSADGNSESEILDEDIIKSLEDGVQYWTDYSKVHYHPHSLYELHGLWMDVQEFDNYGVGRDVFSGGQRGEEINERLRFFIEECDHIQGIQFIADAYGGFSGMAAEFLENIADDYPNIPVLLYTVQKPTSYMKSKGRKLTMSHNLHDAISFSRLSTLCKLIVPVGLPSLTRSKVSRYLSIKDEKPYHSSAVYAAAIHSMSLPFRMEPLGPTSELSNTLGAVDVNEFIQMLAGQARQNMVASLDIAMPAPPLNGYQSEQSLLENMHPLTPELAEDAEDLLAVEAMVMHGLLGSGCVYASVSEVKDVVLSAYKNATTRPKFSHLSVARCPLPIPLPFPSIFRDVIGQRGELLSVPTQGPARGSLEVQSVPVAARLRSSNAVLPFLENRLGHLRKFGIERGALGSELLTSWGFGREEVDDIAETLSKMILTLNPHSPLYSDSD